MKEVVIMKRYHYYSEILNENQELSYYKKVCKEEKITYTKWRQNIIEKIFLGINEIESKYDIVRVNRNQLLIDYRHYLKNKLRNVEKRKDIIMNIYIFVYSGILSYLISKQFATNGLEKLYIIESNFIIYSIKLISMKT